MEKSAQKRPWTQKEAEKDGKICFFSDAGRKKGKEKETNIVDSLRLRGARFAERNRNQMKMKWTAMLLAMLLVLAAASGCAAEQSAQASMKILTTFYPMYVFTLNVTDGIEGVEVANMADQSVGCLHDYQLQTQDMVNLEAASVLVINGGGMEQFMDKVISLRADLPVIDASTGIEMLPAEGYEEHGEGHSHEDEEFNAHVWLDPYLAAEQVKNIGEGLAAVDPGRAEAYRANAERYADRLIALGDEIAAQLSPYAGSPIITFHEAFPYFAEAFGLEVAGVIEHEPGEEPSTREIADTCDLVESLGIHALFVEPQYPQKAAETIARETGASLYTLDPVVSGDGSKESYEMIMRENTRVLTEALAQ